MIKPSHSIAVLRLILNQGPISKTVATKYANSPIGETALSESTSCQLTISVNSGNADKRVSVTIADVQMKCSGALKPTFKIWFQQ